MAHSSLIYLRIFGYVATILMHSINMVCMVVRLHSQEVVELFKDPTIKFFNDNQARYFTCWTFFLQIVYAVVGLTCDVLVLKESKSNQHLLLKRLRGFRDSLFSAVQWPSTFLVAVIFWSLFTLDRELIFPKILDKVLTRASNHVIHSFIVPVMLWEIMFRPRVEPQSHWKNLGHLTFHFVLYFSVLFYTYYEKGVWIYPVFKVTAGTVYFPLFVLAIYILLLVFYFVQWPLTRFFHGSSEKCKTKVQ